MRRPTYALTAPAVINGDPTVRRSTTATENARNADTHTRTTDATGNRPPPHAWNATGPHENPRLFLAPTLAFHYLCLANPRGQSRKCKRPTDKNRSKTQKKQSDRHIEP